MTPGMKLPPGATLVDDSSPPSPPPSSISLPAGANLVEGVQVPSGDQQLIDIRRGEQMPVMRVPTGTLYPPYQPAVRVPAGAPAFQATPGMPPAGTPQKPFNVLEQTGSVINQISAAHWHLAANALNVIDSAVDQVAKWTGLPKGGLFTELTQFAKDQEDARNAEAAQQAGGRTDLPTKIFHAVGTAAGMLPLYIAGAGAAGAAPGLATGVLGPSTASLGMIGALENADRGWKAVLQGAAEGTLMGKFMDVIGPLNRVYRLTGAGLGQYSLLRLHNVDQETALSNALAMGGLSAIGPAGTVGAKEIVAGAKEIPGRIAGAIAPEPSAPAQRLIELGKQYNIPLTAGDISQHAGLKRAEVALEDIPGAGMQSLRAKQSEAAKTAAQGIQEQYSQGLLNTEPSSIEDLRTAAESGDQRARNVLSRIESAGEDPDRLIQASIGLQDWTTRQTAKELYDRVQNLAQQNNLGDVPLDTTGKAIGSSLRELRPAKLPNKDVIGLLEKIRKSITPPVDEQGNPLKDAQGNPVTANNTYGLIRQLHSDLGDQIREYYQGNNALIGEKGVGYLERVHNALEDDMRNYAENSGVPEIVQAGRNADQYYRTARVPFKNGMLAAAATSTEPDAIWQQFIKAGKGDRAQNFYEALDEKGRAAVRYNMVRQAVTDATNPTSGVFSPQKFFSAVEKLKDAYGVFFNPQDLREINGFKNLMGHIVRAGQYAENPPTGQRAIPFILAGGIPTAIGAFFGHPMEATASAAGTVGLIGMARQLFTTEGGRRMLLKAAGMKPGTPIMQDYWQNVAQKAPTQVPPEEPPPGGPPPGGPPAGPGGTPPGGPAPAGEAPSAGQVPGAVSETGGPAARTGTETPGPKDAVRQILNDPDQAANDALNRIRRRGGFEPGQTSNFSPGGDSFNDMVIWSAANLTKAAQKIYAGATDFVGWSKEMVADFGEAIRPYLKPIWERANPLAEAATRDVKRRTLQDMRIRIPDEDRVVSPDPTKTIDGKPFHSLDLSKPGPGFLPMQLRGEGAANQEIQKAWQDSIRESEAPGGQSAADAVKATGARPPDAQFWDKSLSLPDQTRYWYELSGESFTGRHFDLPRTMQPAVIDAVASTSGGAEPPDNMRRAIGLLAENAQRRPSMVDLRDPVSPRRALDPATGAIESRKYGSFSGTMQRTSGLTKDNPLPTNDVQVGSMFDITGNDIGKNPILYEVLSRFFMKMRDMQNQGLIDMHQLPSGEWISNGKPVQPYESWQMQASPWVYERARKNPAMTTRYDDYSQVMDRDILPQLQAAGIPTPGGKITYDTLMDRRTPDVMAPTAPHFRATPSATLEVATTLTPQGARAKANYEAISQLDPSIPWVRDAKNDYERMQRQVMEDLGERYTTVDPKTGEKVKNPSFISQLMSAMTGQTMDVSRINTKAAGTYQGQANPNMRIPLTGRTSEGWRSLDDVERNAFVAYLGKWLNQDASAASHFKVVAPDTGDTYTAFLQTYADKLDIPAIERFAKSLGFDVNAEQTPTGVTLDINIGGRDDRPTRVQVLDALAETFGTDPNVYKWWTGDRAYSSNYVNQTGVKDPKTGETLVPSYDEAINTYEQREAAAKRAAKRAPQVRGPSDTGELGGGYRTSFGNIGDIRWVGRQVQALSKWREGAYDTWSKGVESKLQKYQQKLAKAGGQ